MPDFNFLEKQLIKASLADKTDAEIALLLERNIEEVHQHIDVITGGQALTRSEAIQKQREEQEQQIRDRKKQKDLAQLQKEARRRHADEKKKLNDELKQKKQLQHKEKAQKGRAIEATIMERRRRENRQRLPTRELHLDQLQSVRIDEKTYVFVKPGTNVEAIRKQYSRNLLADFKKTKN